MKQQATRMPMLKGLNKTASLKAISPSAVEESRLRKYFNNANVGPETKELKEINVIMLGQRLYPRNYSINKQEERFQTFELFELGFH